jgi:hypothetical protein
MIINFIVECRVMRGGGGVGGVQKKKGWGGGVYRIGHSMQYAVHVLLHAYGKLCQKTNSRWK